MWLLMLLCVAVAVVGRCCLLFVLCWSLFVDRWSLYVACCWSLLPLVLWALQLVVGSCLFLLVAVVVCVLCIVCRVLFVVDDGVVVDC